MLGENERELVDGLKLRDELDGIEVRGAKARELLVSGVKLFAVLGTRLLVDDGLTLLLGLGVGRESKREVSALAVPEGTRNRAASAGADVPRREGKPCEVKRAR